MRLANVVFSTSLLMVVVRTFVMCVSAYELSKTKQVAHTAEVFGIFWLAMIQLLTLGWLADTVKSKGKALSLLCVQQAWCGVLEQQPPTRRISNISPGRRCLLVMAARCRIPLEMRAGPFYNLSVNMFKKILGAAFSYFIFFFTLTQHRDSKNFLRS
ncbi:hypothetical protein B566_EDAN009192 [Ephemera danica]|nr:hypothetical protein B566_EDAN009192 [Ephemera danica]